jgi:hypothetical protein
MRSESKGLDAGLAGLDAGCATSAGLARFGTMDRGTAIANWN